MAIDDATRLAFVEILADQKRITAVEFFERVRRWFAEQGISRIERVMTDNGSACVSRRFHKLLARLCIRHIRTRPYHPETNGKAGRFIQTLLLGWAYKRPYPTSKHRARALPAWLRYYNERRPHRSLGMSSPTQMCKLSVMQPGANAERSSGSEADRRQDNRVLVASLLWLAAVGFAGMVLATDDLSTVFATLRKNTGLSGNIVASLQAQDWLAELVKQDPGSVVPAIVAELKGPSTAGGKAANYRMALISALEKAGPAAEAAVPVLIEIVQDEKQRNDFVLLKAQMALAAIGTPRARDASQTAGKKSVEHWARGASAADLTRAVAEHAYLIRRELRSTNLSEEVIDASVTALSVMGKDASPAAPEPLQAWRDPPIGTNLRGRITAALGAVGGRGRRSGRWRTRPATRRGPHHPRGSSPTFAATSRW